MTKLEKQWLFENLFFSYENYQHALSHEDVAEKERLYYKGIYDSYWSLMWNFGFIADWLSYKDARLNPKKEDVHDET